MLAFISYPVLLVGIGAGFFLGTVVGLTAMAARRATRRSAVPYGPFMVAGAFAAVLVGAPIAGAYQHLLLSGGTR
jgi:leader peptidase (prepilin peptidase)/N-methyltransferase